MEEQKKDIFTPWWTERNVPWRGNLFEGMILSEEDTGEKRIQKIRKGMLTRYKSGKRRLSFQWARSVTHSYMQTEGRHPAIRRALSIKKGLHEISIGLTEGQLLMGGASCGPHYVDFNPHFPALDFPRKGSCEELDRIYVYDKTELEAFQRDILPFWENKGRMDYFCMEMSENYQEAWKYLNDSQCYIPTVGGPLAHTIQDYKTVLQKGMLGVIADIREQIKSLDMTHPDGMKTLERRNQYEAMIIAGEAMIDYAQRNADYAQKLADAEPEDKRRTELVEMARICKKVPAYPAESWWEALQCFHFLRAATALIEGMDSHSAGRFDQYMLPWLQNDLENGTITRKKAQELLECLFLKWNESTAFTMGLGCPRGNNDKINISGMDELGRDCTNELSFMLLEAHAHVHLTDPALSVRVHHKTPEKLLICTLELLRLGGGLPLLLNDDAIVAGMTANCQVELKDARNYGDVGCQENVTDPNMTGADTSGRQNGGFFSLVKPIELALWNGINPQNGRQAGPKTGDVQSFLSMEAFMEAVGRQMEYAVEMNVIANNVNDYVFTAYYPSVWHNLMHPTPRRTGIDFVAGGAKYNWTGPLGIGLATAGDILAAVDTLIFKQKETAWPVLMEALKNNWTGYEALRQKCIQAPKYGCDDPYADNWSKRILDMWFSSLESYGTAHGGHFIGGLISMDSYITLGHQTGATPDGRRAGEHLSDSVAPSRYSDSRGITARHFSAARAIDTYHTTNGVTFNQRFSMTTVNTSRDIAKWADLVRTYMDAGGQQIQYLVVSAEDLKEAQKNPDEYRDLLVRVGGYSAVFVDLTKELQDSIMAREELAV
ncbi:4-hydroxyphenylacetate decarboxylase large subunit [uncultured Roseburia sp.]|nr:4-hydroxyphenylacetate decarboxylase large subunit [uncultured Roseburia sp.]